MKQLVVVVIIAHKSELTENERASLRQCYKILGRHPIKLICPKGLNVSVYKEINPESEIVFIDPKWQATYKMFNELKKDKLLYEMFSDYEYMLYYELDAWVFRDELEFWCDKGYDYIGAPWFAEENGSGKLTFKLGGNGGFSLRKISTALTILQRIKAISRCRNFWYRSKLQSIFRFEKSQLISKLFSIKIEAGFIGLIGGLHFHEDSFWSKYVPITFPDYKMAPPEESLKFSFEMRAPFLYHYNNDELPFGCHAWEKYESEFWRQFINVRN